MVTVWGALLSFLFVLATALSVNVETTPSKDESKQKDKSEQADESSSKDKSDQADKSSSRNNKNFLAKVSKKNNNICIKNCPDIWRLHH
jgi:hypothetical protein